MKIRNEKLGRLFAVLALATMAFGSITVSAHADRDDHRGYYDNHRGHDRDWRDDEWRRNHRQYYGDRGYVAPPPVYYAPPPPPVGLNLFFHVR